MNVNLVVEILLWWSLLCFILGIGIALCLNYVEVKKNISSMCHRGYYIFCIFTLIFGIGYYVGYQSGIQKIPEVITPEAQVVEVYIPTTVYVSSLINIPEDIETADIVIYDEEVIEAEQIVEQEKRYDFTDRDIYLLGRLLSGSKHIDGDGEYDIDFGKENNHEQISLVLSVVMNRVNDPRFPNTVEEVIFQRYSGQGYQFTPVSKWGKTEVEISDITRQKVQDWCWAYNEGLSGVPSIPEDHVYFSSNGRGLNISRR